MSEAEPEKSSAARGFSAERINTLVQTLAILGAGAWGVYTFIYEARIKPSLEPPAVSVTTSRVKAGERDNRIAIRSTVTRKNVGQTAVRVLGLVYNVAGVRAQFREGAPADLARVLNSRAKVTEVRDYTLVEPGTVILRQGQLFEGAAMQAEPSDLNPGEAVSRDLIFYANRAEYDFVRFEVSLAYAKKDDPPVTLRLEADKQGTLTFMPEADCRADPAPCAQLKTTEFGTEFSLW